MIYNKYKYGIEKWKVNSGNQINMGKSGIEKAGPRQGVLMEILEK